ncbi:MAG TPA: YihY/virulence factor BrkB family protein [Ramlibacter sp.]|jgi:membrane protein
MPLSDRLPQWVRNLAHSVNPIYRASQLWSEAGGMRMSAAMSFYGILSLAPLLLAIVAMLGWWMDRQMLEDNLLRQLGSIVGEQGSGVLKDALASAQEPAEGITASVIGFIVLLFGATGVFGELQEAFEKVWSHGRGPQPKPPFWRMATLRLRGLGYILVFGFLLLVSLVLSTLLNLFSGWAGTWLPLEIAMRVLNEVLAFVICAALFVGLMRLSTGPKPRLRYLVFGGFAGAIMFTAGRQLMALYLSSAAVVSAYGAAGSLIVLLMWIYFSSAVLLLGAGCARALEEHVKDVPPPQEDAAVPTSATANVAGP